MAQSITIKKASGKIKLDAIIDEPDWQNADVANNFQQYFPTDTAKAKSKTEVRLTYDDQFIYISAKMYNLKNVREYVTPSLRRDFRKSFIKKPTSSGGLRQFSELKANKVKYSTFCLTHSSTTLRTASSPSECPATRGINRLVAQRPLPSMMMATCLGTLPTAGTASVELVVAWVIWPNQDG